MKVVTQDVFGGPEVLHIGERDVPEPIPTEVLVRVQAAGVNPVDWKTRAGAGMSGVLGALPFVIGWDVAGVVESTGYGVTQLSPGDLVFGMPWFPREAGGYGEFVTAPSRHFVRRPQSIDAVQAAGLPLASLTAWQVLVDVADVKEGQRVLIHAAAGGVGHLAVQIAKARGATVIGTARQGKHDFLRSIGIDEAIDYQQVEFEKAVDNVDIVVDLIGGDYSLRSISVLKPTGILVTVPSSGAVDVAAAAKARGVRTTGFLVEPDRDGLLEIAGLVEQGKLHCHVAEVFSFENAGEAHRIGEENRTSGKIVLTP